MRLVFVALISFYSIIALASELTGTWRGAGRYETAKLGSISAQAEIRIQFEKSKLSFDDCWSYVKDGNTWNFCTRNEYEIRGNKLYLFGEPVGFIATNAVQIRYSEGTAKIANSISLNSSGKLDFLYDASDDTSFIRTEAYGLSR